MEKIQVYIITATSLDDDHRCNYGYYLSEQLAQEKAGTMNSRMEPKVLAATALQDFDGAIYEMPIKKIEFCDDRFRILAKLTAEERAILGV